MKHPSDGGIVTETTNYIHGYYLVEEIEALKPLLPFSAVKPQAFLEYLAENSRFTEFPFFFYCFEDLLNTTYNSRVR